MEGNSTLALKNDNPYSIRIDSLAYDLQMNGKAYLSGRKLHPIILKAHGIDTFVLPYIQATHQMDKDFADRDSIPATVLLRGYISVLALKRIPVHLHHDFMYVIFKKPEVVGDRNYLKFDTGGMMEAKMILRLANRNKYPVRLDSFFYTVDIGGKNYVNSHRLKPVKAGPLDTVEAALSFSFSRHKYERNLSGRDSAHYHFNFDFLLSGRHFEKAHITIPIDKDLPVFTYFKILSKHFKVRKMTGKDLIIDGSLEIYNPNPVSFHVREASYDLFVEGERWVQGDLKLPFVLPAKKSTVLSIPFNVSIKQVSKEAWEYLKGAKPVHYRLKAGYTLQTPFEKMKEIRMNLADTGILHLFHPSGLKISK